MRESVRQRALLFDLTPFEIAILDGIARGLQSKEIAKELDRSRGTIESYIRVLFIKMNATSRAHLIAIAFSNGILDAALFDRLARGRS